MSQVVNNKDQLLPARNRTLAEEQKILKAPFIKKWQKAGATQALTVEKLIGVAFLPIAVCWAILMAFLSVSMTVAAGCLRGIGQFFNKKKLA